MTDTYSVPKEGLGSFFHSYEDFENKWGSVDFHEEHLLFYTGRHAIKYLLDTISLEKTVNKIWLPKYYCQHVTHWMQTIYSNIDFYEANPFEFDENIDYGSFATKNDIVIINNFWGLCKATKKSGKNKPILIDDHSHGWLTKGCIESGADYCFASLRKSLPIPLGGIAWKPNGSLNLNKSVFQSDNSFYVIWDKIKEAMDLKTKYAQKKENDEPLKEAYLKLIYEAEEEMHQNHNLVELKEGHQTLINSHLKINVVETKKNNLDIIRQKLKKSSCFKLMEKGGLPSFGINLLFNDTSNFSSFKRHLVNNKIYPSHLWPNNPEPYKNDWLINIHIDFRYKEEDIQYIINQINEWKN